MGKPTRQGDSPEGVLFEGVFGRRVAVTFDGERQSDFGGVPLLAALDRRLGLTQRLAQARADGRSPGKVLHSTLDLIRQRVYGIALGFADLNDASRLRHDPALRLSCDRSMEGEEDALASAPSLCRFENGGSRRDIVRMAKALLDAVVGEQARRRRRRATRVTVDLDSSESATYGEQQLSFFNGHFGSWCYHPLFAFVTFHDAHGREEPEQHLVAAMLRPGNVHPGAGGRTLLRKVVERLRASFPRTPIRVRLDGGFSSAAFFDALESLGVQYVVNLPQNPLLREKAEAALARARAASQESGRSERVYGEVPYAAASWNQDQRVILKAEVVRDPARPHREARDNPRFLVTNLPGAAQHIYEAVYCGRGDIENRIKELKDGLSIDRTSCAGFWANQMRVLLASAAFVLLQALRSRMTSRALARAQVATLRERLLLVSARVVSSTRRLHLRLSRALAFAPAWRALALRIGAVPL